MSSSSLLSNLSVSVWNAFLRLLCYPSIFTKRDFVLLSTGAAQVLEERGLVGYLLSTVICSIYINSFNKYSATSL